LRKFTILRRASGIFLSTSTSWTAKIIIDRTIWTRDNTRQFGTVARIGRSWTRTDPGTIGAVSIVLSDNTAKLTCSTVATKTGEIADRAAAGCTRKIGCVTTRDP
jgi:hypothetical protein